MKEAWFSKALRFLKCCLVTVIYLFPVMKEIIFTNSLLALKQTSTQNLVGCFVVCTSMVAES
jgi:hypothetical protein